MRLAGIVNVACVCACICIFASTILAARIFCRSLDNAARKKRTFHQHAKRRRGRNVPSATNAALGQKQTYALQKAMSALPLNSDRESGFGKLCKRRTDQHACAKNED
jgi:hypothetical protein